MRLQNNLQQEVIASIKKSLSYDDSYHNLMPDIMPFITATSKLPLKNLDSWELLIGWEIPSSLQAHDSKYTEEQNDLRGSFAWLDICNANGFIRESALKTLSEGAPNNFLFALLIRKLNDWVPQVRNAACDTLPLIAKLSDPEIVVDALFATLPYWDSWGRIGDTEKNILMKIISMDRVAASLKDRIILATTGPVVAIFTQLGRTNAIDAFLSEIAESSIQPSLRAKAYRCQFEGRFIWVEGRSWQWTDKAYGIRRPVPVLNNRRIDTARPFLENLKMAISDRSPKVRRIAGEMLIKELDNIGEEALRWTEILASDISPSVAERGRYALAALEKRKFDHG